VGSLNYGKRSSYNARITAAILQYNTQQIHEVHENMENVPAIIEKLETANKSCEKEFREINKRQRKATRSRNRSPL